MRTGGGVPSHRYNEVAGDLLDRFNAPVYDALLIHDWLAALPELRDALEEGIEVAELGCGTGHGCRLVGQAFPRSRVTGFDIDGSWFDQGRKEIAEAGLSNVDLVEADVVSLPEGRQYDLVLVLDALHHFGDPQAALREVSRVLRRGGRVLVVEPTMTGDLEADLAAPGAVSTFAGSILYCMQDALAAGGPGYGAGVPASEMSRLFESAGLTPTDARPGHSGYTVYLARRPR
jgi:SAM-dependent methyltransferase